MFPVLAVVAMGGCGGQFIIKAPDLVAPIGGHAAAVVQIQRTELAFLPLAVADATVCLQIGDSPLRAARSDKHGYIVATVPVPSQEGVYTMVIRHQNIDGEEASAGVPAYVWDPNGKIVAVEFDCLPEKGKDAEDARAALHRLAAGGRLLYLIAKDYVQSEPLHEFLETRGYPDGPILPWRPGGRFSKPVSPLPPLRETFPALGLGICHSQEAADAFLRAGMSCVLLGKTRAESPEVTIRLSWAELAAKGP
jgi:hypothetical protein